MKESEQSRTALGAVVIRAVHQIIDDDPRILENPVSVRLLTSESIAQIQADPRRYRTPQAKVLRSHLVLRSRYAEDELYDAARCGIRQFLNLENELKRSDFHEVKFLKPGAAADRYYKGRTDLPPPKKVRLCMAYS